jgi:hypothetical protein
LPYNHFRIDNFISQFISLFKNINNFSFHLGEEQDLSYCFSKICIKCITSLNFCLLNPLIRYFSISHELALPFQSNSSSDLSISTIALSKSSKTGNIATKLLDLLSYIILYALLSSPFIIFKFCK